MQSVTSETTKAAFFEKAAAFFDMDINSVQECVIALSPSLSLELTDEDTVMESKLHAKTFRRRQQRQRRKDGREGLRRQERNLTLQLQKLKQAFEITGLDETSRTSVRLHNFFWRDCASRQCEERMRAEEEQKRLVAATKIQASYIDNLTKLLLKRPLDQVSGPNKRACLESPDEAVYLALLRDIDDCYSRVDDLLVDCGMDDLPLGIMNSVHRRERDGEVEFIQHVNKALHVFDVEHTNSTAWKLGSHPHRQLDGEEYGSVAGLENTKAVKFRVVYTLATGRTVSVLQRLVARRFFRDNAAFNVCKIYSEGEGVLSGMHSDETGWCRFRPSSDSFATFTDLCMRQVPALFRFGDSNSSVFGEFRQVLKEKVDEDERVLSSAMENMLLADTLAILDV